MTISSGSYGINASSPKGILADWQHASKIFLSAGHRLAPRVKFLYYLFVEIDAAAHGASAFTAATQNGAEVSLLVKRAELPKFSFETVTKNQYNRKRVVYKQLQYDPVTLTFHDDNAGVMNSLYGLYYAYYSKDHANTVNDYKLGNSFSGARYNMDIDIRVNLFKRISLFTLGNGVYNEYKLLSPKIRSWSMGDVDYSSNADTVESSMTIEYESVIFKSGPVATSVMDGFATLGYDTMPSPIDIGREISVGRGNLNNSLGSLSYKDLTQRPGIYGPIVSATNQAYLGSSAPPTGRFFDSINPGSVVAIPSSSTYDVAPTIDSLRGSISSVWDSAVDFLGFGPAEISQEGEDPYAAIENVDFAREPLGGDMPTFTEWNYEASDQPVSDFENSYIDVFDEGIDADDETGFADYDF